MIKYRTEVDGLANIKSAIKRVALAKVRAERNRARRSRVKTAVRTYERTLAGGDAEATRQAFKDAARQLDKAVSHGVLHKNTAARKKSRLAARLG